MVTELFDAREVTASLDGLKRYFREHRELAANIALQRMQESFDSQKDPETGKQWPPNKPSTLIAKGNLPTLVMSGRIKASLQKGASGNIFRVGSRAIMVGSSAPSGPFAQYGTRPHRITARSGVLHWPPNNFAVSVNHPGTPQRRFIGVSRVTARLIERELQKGSQRAMR